MRCPRCGLESLDKFTFCDQFALFDRTMHPDGLMTPRKSPRVATDDIL